MGRAVLVTATDTGAGKTYVACLLGRALREDGLSVRPFKPVESGCREGPGGAPLPADAVALRDAISPDLPLSEVCPYPLSAPLSPHLAARAEGRTIDAARIRAEIGRASEACDIVLVEGAGGIAVEIREGYSFADLARDSDLSVLVVVENRLGALNHAKLTIHALASAGLSLLGVILNDRSPGPFPAREPNEEEIRRIAGDRYLGRIPHGARSLPGEILSVLRGSGLRRNPLPPEHPL